jgi:DNA-binding transcriptional regulator YiaG
VTLKQMTNPTPAEKKQSRPEQIKSIRLELGLTQTEAGELIGAKLRTWQDWESGARNMPNAKLELFLIKTWRNDGIK